MVNFLSTKWLADDEQRLTMTRCLQRASSWCVPPNWGVEEWREELRAVQELAMIEALGDHGQYPDVAWLAFLYQRVMARSLAFYRKEWSFAVHCTSGPAIAVDGDSNLPERNQEATTLCWLESYASHEELHGALLALAEADQSLILDLFWEEQTESEIARTTRVSQPAVNKRKQLAVETLRTRMRSGLPLGYATAAAI